MTWVAVAVAGGAVVGAVVSSNGAKSAASTQAGAARDASQTQWNIFQQTNHNQQPYMDAGYGASDVLSRLLGLRTSAADAPANASVYGAPYGGSSTNYPPAGTTTGIRIGGPNDAGIRMHPTLQLSGSSGYGGGVSGGVSRGPVYNADGTLNEAASRGSPTGPTNLSGGANGSSTFPQADWSAGGPGYAGIPRPNLGDNVGLPDGYLTQQFGPQQFAEGIDPGYSWRFQQGAQGVMNGAAPSVGSLSGPALKSLMDYGQGEASQEFGSAFNRFQTQQGNIFQRLSAVASLGQNAAANVGNQGVVTGGNIGSNIVGAGNASAAGQIGAANAWSNAAGTLASIPYLRSTAAAQGG